MTATEQHIIKNKENLKKFILDSVNKQPKNRPHIWNDLMDSILPKIHEFEKNIISTFSSEFINDDRTQIIHFLEMRKHLYDVNTYYDNLIADWVKRNPQ